jgi:hypothetical protein
MMKKGLSPISSLLKTMSKNLGLEKGMDLFHLREAWPEIVGPAIASHTAPQAIRYQALTIHVDGAAWLHELSFLKEDLRQKINRRIADHPIHTVRLKIGPVSGAPEKSGIPETPLKRKTLSKEARTLVQEQLTVVSKADDALKRAIQKAMVHHLEKG